MTTAAKTHIRVYEEDKFRIERFLRKWRRSRVAKNQPEAVKHLLDLAEAQEKGDVGASPCVTPHREARKST